jgi:hypothetical protein
MAKRRRKILAFLGIVLLSLVVLVAALPIWFPWVIRPILQRYGVRYAACERIGYARFALRKVTFVQGDTTVEAQSVEAPIPTVWLWWIYIGKQKPPAAWVSVSDWHVTVSSQTIRAGASAGSSAYSALRGASADLQVVKKWLPKVSLTNGSVAIDRTTVLLSSATWDRGKLVARVAEPSSRQSGMVEVDTGTNLSWQVSMKVDALDLDSRILITENATNLQLSGSVLWRSNRFGVSAQLGTQGWIPEQATVTSQSVRIPAASLRLTGYDELSGSLNARWDHGRFALNVIAEARPLAYSTYPPLQATVRANGDTQSATIETASLTLPWLKAQLSSGVRMDFKGRLLSPEAVVQISADLTRQPFIAASGNLDGEARFRAGPGTFPTTSFHFSTTGLSSHGIQTKALTLSGELDDAWPKPSYSVRVDIEGSNIRGFVPLKAQVDVRGQGMSFENFRGQFIAGESSLTMAGNGNVAGPVGLHMETLDFDRRGQNQFKLTQPFEISCTAAGNSGTNQTGPWTLKLESIRWVGSGRELSIKANVTWPVTGSVSSTAHNVDLDLFQDFVPKTLPPVRVGQFEFSGAWTNGPVRFKSDLTAALLETTNAPFSAEVQVSGDEKGVSVRRLVVSTEREAVVSGHGVLPLTIEPGRGPNILNVQADQPLDFSASTRTNAAFWNEMASLVGIRFNDPQLELNISGTPVTPQGKVTLTARRIEFLKASLNALRLEQLTANLTIDQRRAKLDEFKALVQGQPITATGEFPLTGKLFGDFRTMVDWDRSTAHVAATNAQLVAFAPVLSNVLAPRGRVSLDISVQPGRQINGSLTLTGAATQPLGTMGAFLDINAKLKLANRRLAIENCSGFLGGGLLNVEGGADLEMPEKGKLPKFEFKVRGSNVPLVRQPDVIVRSDVNVVITNSGPEPVVSGNVILKNSFYLKDLADLIPGEVSTPDQRPPYFSVSDRPFADWRLDLAVTGTNFMKVRTPYFTGGISVKSKMHGTLKEPVAVGEARIVSGTILFPFTSMEVKQGLISLFSDNPFLPQIFVTAASKTFGYDIHLEITGPATQPKLVFSSTPPLTSEQALLMVTAGVLPEGEGNFTTQQRAQRLALFLGKSFMSKLGLGGDADRLTIRSGEYLTEQGGETYSLEYRLTKRLSIVGEYNRFDEIVFSLRWKVYSK